MVTYMYSKRRSPRTPSRTQNYQKVEPHFRDAQAVEPLVSQNDGTSEHLWPTKTRYSTRDHPGTYTQYTVYSMHTPESIQYSVVSRFPSGTDRTRITVTIELYRLHYSRLIGKKKQVHDDTRMQHTRLSKTTEITTGARISTNYFLNGDKKKIRPQQKRGGGGMP